MVYFGYQAHFKIRKILHIPHKISDSFHLDFEGIFPTDATKLVRSIASAFS